MKYIFYIFLLSSLLNGMAPQKIVANSPTSVEPIEPIEVLSNLPHHSHTNTVIQGTIENHTGQDMVVNLEVNKLRESNGTDPVERKNYRRILIMTNAGTAIITATITAGAALAIEYGYCKK